MNTGKKHRPAPLKITPPALEHTRDFFTVAEAAAKVDVCEQRIRQLLQQRRIVGAQKFGHVWMIPVPFVVLKTEQRPREPSKLGKMPKA